MPDNFNQGEPIASDLVGGVHFPVQKVGIPPGAALGAAAVGAAQSNAATLGGAANLTTYITGFQVTGAGATGASVVDVTVTGLLGGTQTYKMAIPAGALVGVTPLIVSFPLALPASAVNTAIVVTAGTFGTGNLHAAVCAQGFRR